MGYNEKNKAIYLKNVMEHWSGKSKKEIAFDFMRSAISHKPSFSGRNPIFPKARFLMAFGTENLPETRFEIKGSKTLFQSAVEGGF